MVYTTIEAEIENGLVKSPDLRKLPSAAHVLITWLTPSQEQVSYDLETQSYLVSS